MKNHSIFSLVVACVLAITMIVGSGTMSVSASAASQTSDTVKILALGDSITDGYWTSGAYRKYLYYYLEQMGHTNIDMVGPKGSDSESFQYNGQTVAYDGNYAGYSGYAIQNISGTETRSGILEVIQGNYGNGQNMISAYDPDIVLLQIGTNDILSNYNDGISNRLDNLVETILCSLDGTNDLLYVSTIPDINVAERYDWLWSYGISYYTDPEGLTKKVQECINSYNAAIQSLVEKKQAEGKNIAYADIHSVLDQDTDLYDGVHPNEIGYENMGKYWANLLHSTYFEGSDSSSTDTSTTTTQTTTTTTKTTTTTTATTKSTITPSGNNIVLYDVKIGETYDLTRYKDADINAISFVFDQTPQYGMNGCVAFGNWEHTQNYTGDDLVNNTITVSIDKAYNSMVLYKWYGDVNLESVVLHCGDTAETTTTIITKPTTTTTTTTKPTTTTTTTTKPTTTTTTTTKSTTTTTTTTKPTTTTTSTTKPTTITTQTTASTTTTEGTINTVVLTDVIFGESYDLSNYDYHSITQIELQFEGNIGYGFGGALVLGNWTVQNSYGHTDMDNNYTITFDISNPQDRFVLYRYWGEIELKAMVLHFTD